MSILGSAMATGTAPPPGPTPDDFSAKWWASGAGKNCSSSDHLTKGASEYGQVLVPPAASYAAGAVALVTFAGSNPINDAHTEGSYFEVQKCESAASCETPVVVAVDSDWETRFHIIKSTVGVKETARAWTVEWHIPAATPAGSYRVVVNGKSCVNGIIDNSYIPFVGESPTFTVG